VNSGMAIGFRFWFETVVLCFRRWSSQLHPRH